MDSVIEKQYALTMADRAKSYGFEGVDVDGVIYWSLLAF